MVLGGLCPPLPLDTVSGPHRAWNGTSLSSSIVPRRSLLTQADTLFWNSHIVNQSSLPTGIIEQFRNSNLKEYDKVKFLIVERDVGESLRGCFSNVADHHSYL